MYQHCFYCGYHLVISCANMFVCGAYSLILWFNVYVTWSEPCAERINRLCTNIAFIVVIIWWYDYIRLQNPQIFFQLFYELCRHIVYVIWSYHVQNELIAWLSHYCANIFLEHEAYSFVDEGWNKFLGLLYDSKHINLSWQMSTKFFMPPLMEPHVIICLLGVLCVKFFAGSYNWKYIF